MKPKAEAGDPWPRMGERTSGLDIRAGVGTASGARPRVVEQGAWDALLSRHFRDVYRIVARLLGPGAPEADVEDVAQQVFLAAHRAWPRFRGESQVSTWLYGIATRVVLTQLRSFRRQRRLQAAVEVEPVYSEVRRPDQRYEDREELQRIWRCLLKIKPKKRVVYLLHEIEEKSAEEIGALLEIPVGTVWTRLHHARRELELLLAKSAGRRG